MLHGARERELCCRKATFSQSGGRPIKALATELTRSFLGDEQELLFRVRLGPVDQDSAPAVGEMGVEALLMGTVSETVAERVG